MAKSDIFMHCGHLQFRRGSWHHRNYILLNGKHYRLTIPIKKAPLNTPIRDVRFAGEVWKEKHLATLAFAYGHAPFFEMYYPVIKDLIYAFSTLEGLDIELINQIAFWLGIKTQIVDSRGWNFSGDAMDMIIQMCKAVGADAYLSNPGAAAYIDLEEEDRTEKEGVKHGWLDFKDPDEEPLSAVHHLFVRGPETARFIR
jgi:hypothetical protein